MIAATALILLAEATATCPPVNRIGGGAMLVRPVATFEELPFELLGPTEDIRTRPTDVQQTAADVATGDEPAVDQPAVCEAVDFPIA